MFVRVSLSRALSLCLSLPLSASLCLSLPLCLSVSLSLPCTFWKEAMFCMGRYPGMIGHSMHRSLQLRTNLKKRNKDTYQLLKISTVYDVQCTMYSVRCTVYSVQCTVCSVQCTVTGCQVYGVRLQVLKTTGDPVHWYKQTGE